MTGNTLGDLLDAAIAADPSATALVDAPNRSEFFHGDPLRLSWSDLDAMVDGLAGDLVALGVGPGDRVGVQLPNVAELVLSLLATIRLGAVAVPFPIQHRRHELTTGIGTAHVSVFVTGPRPDRPSQVADVVDVASEIGDVTVASFGDPDERVARLVPHAAAAVPRPDADVDDTVTICWTSGTTGMPKGVPRNHTMWTAAAGGQVDGIGLGADDRILCPFPLVNMAGLGGMFFPWLMSRCRLVLHQPLDLPVFLGQIEGEQITYTVAPPPLLNMLLRTPALLDGVDLSSVRAITSGSAPLDPWMVAGWQDRGIEVVNVFGSNEGASLMSTREMVPDPEDRARFFPRVGRPEVEWPISTDIETKLVDLTTGSEITEPGHQGELRFRGATIFDGYIDSDGSEFDEDGFFRTGDVFELAGDTDPPRYYRFVDRAKDIIIRGGMNVSAAEVEALLTSHPAVAEAAAVGYRDADLGERVGVFVVAAPDTTPTLDELIAHMRAADVASYKLPERLEILGELPRNPVGKIVKPDLRARWDTP